MQGNPTKSTFGWDLLPDKNCVEGGHPSCRAVFPGHSQLSVWDSTQKDNDRYQSRTVNPTLDAGHPPKVSCLPQQTTCKEEGKRRRLARNLSLDRYLDLLHTLSRSSNSTSDYCQIRQLNEQESSAIRLDDLKAVLSVAGCSVIARTKLDYLRQMCGMYLASPTCIGIEIDLDLPDRGSPSSPLLGGIKRGLEWLASGRLGSDVIPVVAQNGYYSYCELEQNRCTHENQYEGSCSFSPEVKAVDGADFCQTRSETRLSQPVIPRIELVDNAIDCPLQQDSPRYEHIKWLISEMIDISKQYNINDKDRLDVFVGCKVLIVIIEDLINEGACLLNQGLYIAE